MIADPPSEVGALHVRRTWVLPAVVVTAVGAPGTVRGVTALDGEDANEFPAAFIAVTVKVYAVPLVSPVNVQVSALTLVQPTGAETNGDEVTVYPVIAAPPFDAGACHVTIDWLFPIDAETPDGASGIVRGVMAAEATDPLEDPATLVAITVKL